MSLLDNTAFWSGLTAWALAQAVKMLLHFRQKREVDFTLLVSTGGMPSAHSAMVSGLATSVGLSAGWHTPIFAVTLAFAIVVMFDAQSVRRAAGQQARLLNQIVQELFRTHHLSQTRLAELLGHTRLEVGMGLLLGVFTALAMHGWLTP